ncbi:MAG: hypothetical protein H7Z16_03630 [Pyrinomonadaceae bacterium]|nr:hypothetical protein [Pyrinomonadaceae bacterium]
MLRLKKSFLLLHVVLPMLVGGLIYVCWRDPGLTMFKWFRALGWEPIILQLRLAAAAGTTALPFWFVYSLPDGLWVYALTAFMGHVWSGSRASVSKIACLGVGPVLGAGSELGQLARLVPGSFDWTDLVFYLAAVALAFFAVARSNSKRSFNEKSNTEDLAFINRVGNFSAVGLRQRVLNEQERFQQ